MVLNEHVYIAVSTSKKKPHVVGNISLHADVLHGRDMLRADNVPTSIHSILGPKSLLRKAEKRFEKKIFVS
jgi:hypothetical protein